jgi:hypothetical protein
VPHQDAIKLFRDALDAINREDWRGIAALCDAESLESFKADLLAKLSPDMNLLPKLSATELMKAVPSMPRAVAEYEIQRFREQFDPRKRMREELPSVKSVDALEAMSASEVYVAWLDGRSFKREIDRNLEHKRMNRATANEVIAEGAPRVLAEPLGFVDDGASVRYVIFRRDIGDKRPGTLMLRRQSDGGWLLVADQPFLTTRTRPMPLVEEKSMMDEKLSS